MARNNHVELYGHLGADAKIVGKDDKTFLVLSVATTDSYAVEEKGEETKWKARETIWHDVLIFRKTPMQFARDLKKGDRVRIDGEISYRPFKDAEGYTRKQANIIGTFVEKIDYEKQEELLPRSYGKEIDEALAHTQG